MGGVPGHNACARALVRSALFAACEDGPVAEPGWSHAPAQTPPRWRMVSREGACTGGGSPPARARLLRHCTRTLSPDHQLCQLQTAEHVSLECQWLVPKRRKAGAQGWTEACSRMLSCPRFPVCVSVSPPPHRRPEGDPQGRGGRGCGHLTCPGPGATYSPAGTRRPWPPPSTATRATSGAGPPAPGRR